jgi:phosphomannomutase
VVDLIAEHYLKSDAKIDRLDGARILDDEGWILIRSSNTEPVIKVIVEGYHVDSFKKKSEEIFGILRSKMQALGLTMELIEAKNA